MLSVNNLTNIIKSENEAINIHKTNTLERQKIHYMVNQTTAASGRQ